MVSVEAKDLISRMLEKDPSRRISANDAMKHKWFSLSDDQHAPCDKKIVQRLKEFRAPQRLQLETLTFLVSNLNKDIDFKNLREAFRSLDKNNTGMLTMEEIKGAFIESSIP